MKVYVVEAKQPLGNKSTLYPLLEGVQSARVPGKMPLSERAEIPLGGSSERNKPGIGLSNKASVFKEGNGKSLPVAGWGLVHAQLNPWATCVGP